MPDLVKPDVTAPGLDIIAAYRSNAPEPGEPTTEYAVVSGTSMSSPHTAGAAALLRALHPTWTVPEIKSALMTTGRTTGVVKEDGATQADPFDMGGGSVRRRIQPPRPASCWTLLRACIRRPTPAPAAVLDRSNIASMGEDACPTICSWIRTVKATRNGTWTASYVTPAGLTLSVTPANFTLAAGATQQLTIQANTGACR